MSFKQGETRPRVIAVGQLWRFASQDEVDEIRRLNADGTWTCLDGLDWSSKDIVDDKDWIFIGYASPPAPVTPQPGQRWKLVKSNPGEVAAGSTFTIKSVHESTVSVRWEGDVPGTWNLTSMLERCSPVDTPAPATPGRVMGVDAGGYAVRCLICGGFKPNERRGYFCLTCLPGDNLTEEQKRIMAEWAAGARDFPREHRPQAMTGPRATGRCFRCNGVHAEAMCPPGWCSAAEDERRAGKPAVAVEPARPAVETWRERSYGPMRGPCSVAGCPDVAAHGRVDICERHIAEAMAFSDGCRLAPQLFPSLSDAPSPQQSHVLTSGGVWNLRANQAALRAGR